jgi:hypothetical protein
MLTDQQIKENIDRISKEIYQIAIKTARDILAANEQSRPIITITLNSEKQRRELKKTMLSDELTKANEQLRINAELSQADDC